LKVWKNKGVNVNYRMKLQVVAMVVFVLAVFIFLHGCSVPEQGGPNTEEWFSLFNGKDLDGWMVKITGFEAGENFGDTFRVTDGVLSVSYDQYENFNGKFGHIFYLGKFSHYRLRLDYRFVGDQVEGGPGWAFRNSGIMLHSGAPDKMSKDQRFPVSLEAQLLGGNGTDERSTGNLCTPGTHVVMDGKLVKEHCTSSDSKTYHGDQWVTAEVEVRGNSVIKHIINGTVVIEYSQPQLEESGPDDDKMLSEGYFSLQSESHPVEFRNIEILLLDE